MIKNVSILSGLSLISLASSQYLGCPPDGPLLPPPQRLQESALIQNASRQLQSAIDDALSGNTQAGWAVENASFSIGLVTSDQTSERPIWEYHHRAAANVNGTAIVNGDTQYLVGSISKLISALLALRTGIDLDASITEYFPQLANKSSAIQWESVKLGYLADHLSGIPPNYGFSEFFILQPLLEQLGFPPITPADVADCGIPGLNRACSEEQLLEGMLKSHPITLPAQRPVYSQLSFALLSYALSQKYNKTYAELLEDHIVQPFSLTNTGASPGNSSVAVIPPVENSWGSDYGDNAPGGGLYSSLNDMTRLVKAILDKSALNTEAEVREWLKPHSSTSSPTTLVGRPWEIFRSTNLTPDHPHTIDVYSKNGGAYGYTSQMAVIDQYGIGFVILTAGPAKVYRILYDSMLSVFVSALEEEARFQAQKYVGTFASDDALVQLNTSIDDGPGIKLDSLTRNGSDILDAIQQFYTQALPQFGALSPQFRMFPAEFEVEDTMLVNGNNITVVKEDWRINLDFLPNTNETSGSDLPGQGSWQSYCGAWQTTDWFYYGNEAVDRVVFLKEKYSQDVLGVDVPFLRASLKSS
ncbi:beta-lactamase/transpeptidase-like protein [Polyplosphaeria fusca]|uniref:Beta-lactamase/transpeptidase-like protein n=1 Tax=Polyplosphaeria fusca TaxID=682080 RepID=A0A9P4UX10_9PLEO|nr:beta-lactamase/transpeptidase-like protein [Polyplosphaeria fusca]